MNVSQKIYKLRTSREMTQAQIAKIAGVSDKAVSAWESGTRDPKLRAIQNICSYFKLDMNSFVDESLDDFEPTNSSNNTIIPAGFSPMPETELRPRVGRIACGEPITAEENIEDYDEVLKSWHADFTLMCCGDSMLPKIQDGDVVAIRAKQTVDNGQIAAVRIGDEATLKRVFLHPDYIELRPLNPDYDSIIRHKEEMDDIRIEGIAVGLCRNL